MRSRAADERQASARAALERAAALDRGGRYAEAVAAYQAGLRLLGAAIAAETDERFAARLAATAKEFLARVEQIQRADAASVAVAGPAAPPARGVAPIERPDTTFDDVVGNDEAKRAFFEAVTVPQTYPHFFDDARRPWKGVLLYGPPGTGKTMLARAVANANDGKFLSICAADVMNTYLGESEKSVRAVFAQARALGSCILFIDEVDALVSHRGEGGASDSEVTNRVKSVFLQCMDGVEVAGSGVFVVGATNLPWNIDKAILRRLERHVYVRLPDAAARRAMVRAKLERTANVLSDADVESVVRRSERMSGANVESLFKAALGRPMAQVRDATRWLVREGEAVPTVAEPCCVRGEDPCPTCGSREATLADFPPAAVRLRPLALSDFDAAFRVVHPTSSPDEVRRYEDWAHT